MSMELINLAKSLVSSKITADDFESDFFKLWREEGASGKLLNDNKDIGECASELFILADCYTSDPDRLESELDEDGLKREVKSTLEKYNLN